MKPSSRKAFHSASFLQNIDAGPVIAKIQGSTKKLGQQYNDVIVALYNKANMQPITITKPDNDGNYQFLGLNTSLKTFIVAFDQGLQFNAVIQDNVVPE